MCMCFPGSCGVPNFQAGSIIQELESGDEVKLKKGVGHPPIEEETTQVICDRDKFSALTNKGVKLMCKDGYGIELTGNHFDEDEYEINEKAQEILDDLDR